MRALEIRTAGAAVLAVVLASCGSSSPGGAPAPSAGGHVAFGSRGPWPAENAIYGASDGIREAPVVGVTTDEAENRWVATQQALYLLRPGDKAFRRYDAADGLHLQSNPVTYCDDHPIHAGDHCGGQLSTGAAADPGISTIAGGGPGEVLVGYHGVDETPGTRCPPKSATGDGDGDYCDPARHSGKLDRVRLNADGTLKVDRIDLVAGRHGGEYWHDRTVQSLAYDHFAHPHTAYAGTNHGVVILFPDKLREPSPGEWYDTAYLEFMGDHLHAQICAGEPCSTSNMGLLRLGDWKGLAVDGNGDLWHAGRWTAGLIGWDADPGDWFGRNGHAFKLAFGDPYPVAANAAGFTNEPVFKVAREGDSVYLTGVTVCPDGRVWFSSSGPQTGTSDTIAVWDGKRFESHAATDLGLGERAVRAIACLPDGRLAIAGFTTGVVLYDPAGRTSKAVPGLPSGDVHGLEVDRMISPPALHVATGAGAAILRVLP